MTRRRERFVLALSGGRISEKFFKAITAEVAGRRASFDRVHFFWADERCVPPDHEESNYRQAIEMLFQPAQISADRIHRIRGELPPDEAAREAERELRSVTQTAGSDCPVMDLIILGMGEDGHVASLFPADEQPENPSVFRVVRNSPKPPPTRVSLSYRAMAVARQVWVLISGDGKLAALRTSLSSPDSTPLSRVISSRNQTRIWSDSRVG